MFVFVVKRLLRNNNWAAANAIGPVILVKTEHAHNRGLLAHERWHAALWWIGLAVFGAAGAAILWYLGLPIVYAALGSCVKPLLGLIPRVRFWEESVAYAIQTHINGSAIETYGRLLSVHYPVNRTPEQCTESIRCAQKWLLDRGWL